jgi:hypothetical protein
MNFMSAIAETEPGGEMVCILGFSARPRGPDGQRIPGAQRRFHVGERVRFIAFFYDATPEDNPVGYMAIFQPEDPADTNQYAATQSYFVTLDCWEGIRGHIVAQLEKAHEPHQTAIVASPKKVRKRA